MVTFFGTRPVSFSVFARILSDPGICPDSTTFTYSHSSYLFSGLARSVFRYSHGFYLIPVLARILPFIGIHTDGKLFRDSPGQFFGIRTDSTLSRYWPGFYHFSVFTLVVTFCRTRRVSFSVLARILRDPGITPDSIICRYSHLW